MAVKFARSNKDKELIKRIASRAKRLAKEHGISYPVLEIEMDVSACHANGNKLKLTELLGADDFNFSHDIVGIKKNLNRETGALENFFMPRYSSFN